MEIESSIALKLQQYARELWKWNEQLNLTRHTTWELFVGRDLRDCLQLAALLQPGEEVLDLGSGNGIPGIALAILRSDIDVALAESVAKRAWVLSQIVESLELPVTVYAARGEDLFDDFRFSSVVCRVVGSISKTLRLGPAALGQSRSAAVDQGGSRSGGRPGIRGCFRTCRSVASPPIRWAMTTKMRA